MSSVAIDILQSGSSWVAPASGTGYVHCYGAGGEASPTNGGGSGACAVKAVTFVEGQSYALSIGDILGGDGGDTNFDSICIGAGGKSAANGGAGGLAAACTGDSAFSGANASGTFGGSCAGSLANGGVGAAARGGFPDGCGGQIFTELGSIYGIGGTSSSASGAGIYPPGAGATRIYYPDVHHPAFPNVVSHTYGQNDAVSTTINVTPPPAAAVGDQLVVIIGRASAGSVITNSGWTVLGSVSSRFHVLIRVFSGADDWSFTASVSGRFTWAVWAIRGAESNAVNIAADAGGVVGPNPVPPAYTGAPSNKYLFITASTWSTPNNAGPLSWPNNLVAKNIIPKRQSGLNDDMMYGWAYLEGTGFTPQPWGRLSTISNVTAYSVTLVVTPVDGGGFVEVLEPVTESMTGVVGGSPSPTVHNAHFYGAIA